MRFLPTYVLQYADEDLYFFQLPCLKEPTKQDDETKGVSEVCGLGFVRSLFWSFLIPPFLWIYRTDYFVWCLAGT